MVVRMKMTGLQLLFLALLYTPVIVAEDLDPVEFYISKNYPRNKTLIPLPKDFDKFGDQKNDCCALQLFIVVKDYNAEGTGNGDGYSDNESQTETGSVTFNFEHPAIRKSDIKYTMSVEKDKAKVKSKHLLNFDNCTNIIYKTFNIYATTTIADDKDVSVVLVNGKDHKIVCTDPNLAPEPREDQAHNDIVLVLVCVIVVLITGWLLYYNYRKIKEICSNTYIKLTTSQKPEVINLSESAASEGGEVKERGGRGKPRAVEGESNLHTEEKESANNEKYRPRSKPDVSSNPDSDRSDDERGSLNNIKSSNSDSDSDDERGSVNNIKSLGSQTRGKETSTEGVDKLKTIKDVSEDVSPELENDLFETPEMTDQNSALNGRDSCVCLATDGLDRNDDLLKNMSNKEVLKRMETTKEARVKLTQQLLKISQFEEKLFNKLKSNLQ